MTFTTAVLGILLLSVAVYGKGSHHNTHDSGTHDPGSTGTDVAPGGTQVDHSTHSPVHPSTNGPTAAPSTHDPTAATTTVAQTAAQTTAAPTQAQTTASMMITTTTGYDVPTTSTAAPLPVVAATSDPLMEVFCHNLATMSCTEGLDVVCGSDKQFYPNKCELTKARCKDPSLTLAETATCIA